MAKHNRRTLIETVSPGQNWDYTVEFRDIIDDDVLKANSFVFFAPLTFYPMGYARTEAELADRNLAKAQIIRQLEMLSQYYENQGNPIFQAGQANIARLLAMTNPVAINDFETYKVTKEFLDAQIRRRHTNLHNPVKSSKLYNATLLRARAIIKELDTGHHIIEEVRVPVVHADHPANINPNDIPPEALIINYPFTRDSIYTVGITSYEAKLGDNIEVAVTGEYSLLTENVKLSSSNIVYLRSVLKDVEHVPNDFTVNSTILPGSQVYWDYGFVAEPDGSISIDHDKRGIYFDYDRPNNNIISRFYIGKTSEPINYKLNYHTDAVHPAPEDWRIRIQFDIKRFIIYLNAWFKN